MSFFLDHETGYDLGFPFPFFLPLDGGGPSASTLGGGGGGSTGVAATCLCV